MLWHWYKRNWRHYSEPIRLARLISYARIRFLRHRALSCQDDRLRLKAACRLGDPRILKQIAMSVASPTVRAAAADAIDHPAFLTAIALETRDVAQGRALLARIPYKLQLRRIAQSAREDGIRLIAAQKLGDTRMLLKIARETRDFTLRWRAARDLNDPQLLAEVALYQPKGDRLCALRHEAFAALMNHFDLLARQRNTSALLSFLWAQPHLPFKLHAFLRLPADHLRKPVLQHLARQKYSDVSPKMIRQMLLKIEKAGWRLDSVLEDSACLHCGGKGLQLKTLSSASTHYAPARISCPHCSGAGAKEILRVTCSGEDHHRVIFEFPASTL